MHTLQPASQPSLSVASMPPTTQYWLTTVCCRQAVATRPVMGTRRCRISQAPPTARVTQPASQSAVSSARLRPLHVSLSRPANQLCHQCPLMGSRLRCAVTGMRVVYTHLMDSDFRPNFGRLLASTNADFSDLHSQLSVCWKVFARGRLIRIKG